MDLQDVIEFCRAQAIASSLSPDEDGIWRYICRSYSKTFNTPLHLVLSMDPEHVILNYYEDQLDGKDPEDDLENLLENIYQLEDPNYERQRSKEVEDFIEQAEEEERQRIAKGKPIHPAMRKEASLPQTELPNGPTGGSINLSYLESQDSEG